MWIKNVHLVDPAQGISGIRNVLVQDGVIQAISTDLDTGEQLSDEQALDGTGKYLFPGLIDVHTHLREPGLEEKEDIASGSAAAIRGGFTGIMAMPNTQPVIDQRALVEFVKHQGERAGLARVYPIAAVTKGQRGEELTEMVDLRAGGAVALSDDGRPIMNAEVMRLALEYAKLPDLIVITHSEDANLALDGCMHWGETSLALGLKGIPSSAEAVMVARDMLLAAQTGGKLHVAHVSAWESVEIIRQAKRQGIDVTAEVNPHHLIFSDEDVTLNSTALKVNPPLRSQEDCEALLQGALDGTIDFLATDHAPHTWEEKAQPMPEAPFGILGLETALPAVWQYLVQPGRLSVEKMVEMWSALPARRFHLPGGSLKVGEAADMVLFDPLAKERVSRDNLASKASNTPFLDQELRGLPVMTWVAGGLKQKDRRIL
ncbi:MAG: dihydroorotase [Peptococcaceae bacterium]|jgi:dihydroorotase|nr:dihydroorotase [Peptococcaceae bacterium]